VAVLNISVWQAELPDALCAMLQHD